MPGAPPGDEVPGDQSAQGAGGAGDEDGAFRVPLGARSPLLGNGTPDQPRLVQYAVSDGELGLSSVECGGQGEHGAGAAVDVHEHEPAGVLRLRGPYEAPQGCGREVVGPPAVRTECAPGHERQPGAREPCLRQPGVHRGERRGRDLPYRVGGVAPGAARAADQDDLGKRHPGRHGGRQGIEIHEGLHRNARFGERTRDPQDV